MKIHLLAGPPFGETLWKDTSKRLLHLGYSTEITVLFEQTSSIEKEVETLKAKIHSSDVCLSHGLANPVAIELA